MVPVSFYIILYHCGGAIFSANRFRYGLDLAADFDSGFYFVHGINVDTVYAVFFQVTDLADRIVDTCFAHVLLVISVGGDEICQSLGNGGTGQRYGSTQLFRSSDRHNPCVDGNTDAHSMNLVKETIEKRVVEEHLRDQGADTGIYFLFEMLQVIFQAGRFEMFLGIAGAGYLKAGMFLQVMDQVGRVIEFTAVVLLVAHGKRPVSAESKYMIHAGFLQSSAVFVQIFLRKADAGDMGDGINVQLLLDVGSDLYCLTGSGAAGAVGAADKVRMQSGQLLQERIYILEFFIFLRREHFEGESRFVLGGSMCHVSTLLLQHCTNNSEYSSIILSFHHNKFLILYLKYRNINLCDRQETKLSGIVTRSL